MCTSPIYIKNPNYGRKPDLFGKLVDCTSLYIPINCGHCSQCIALNQMYFVQRIQMESINNYLFMATLTYNNESLSRLEVNGFSIPFADIEDIQKMMKRIRIDDAFDRPFKFFCVSELGSERGRPHFHLLISLPKFCVDTPYTPINLEKKLYDVVFRYWSHNVGSRKNPVYKGNCTYHSAFRNHKLVSNYDLHYLVPYATDKGIANVAFYCLKYMLKLSDREQNLQRALRLNLSPESYKHIYQIVKSKKTFSKGFGLIRSSYSYDQRKKITPEMFDSDIARHIRNSINFSREQSAFPFYIHPDDGSTFPLSPYYRKYFLTLDDALCFWNYNSTSDKKDSFFEHEYTSKDQFNQFQRNFDRIQQIVFSHDIESIF